MRIALLFTLLVVLLSGCNKEKNWEHWDALATKKLEQINNLSKKYTCADISNLTFQTFPCYCSYTIIVHKKDIQEYNELVMEYQVYSKKAHEAGKQIPYYDMCAVNYPLKIICKDDKPHIVDLFNIELDDLNIEISKLYAEIKNYYNNTTCTNIRDWQGLFLLNGESTEAIASKTSDNIFHFRVNIYNQMNQKKLFLENKEITVDFNKTITVKCENNKPVAEFK